MLIARCASRLATVLTGLLVLLAVAGCGGSPSAKERLNAELRRTGKSRDAVFPFAGKVTLDGQPIQLKKRSQKLIVMLYDVAQPDLPVAARPRAECGPDGRFVFNTYVEGDGVPAGHYVVTIAQLTYKNKRGYSGPDGLKNLYNDPEKNATSDLFNIEHHARGKTDYLFDLKLIGEEPNSSPGPKSLIAIRN